VSVKKARGKAKETTTEKPEKPAKPTTEASAKENVEAKKDGTDVVEVRESINELVKESAKAIAIAVIEVAKSGQLAPAKYLFEAAGIYPVMEQTAMRPIETSLAHTLLTRMGLPLEPVICDEDPVPAGLMRDAGGATGTVRAMVVEEIPEEEHSEDAGPVLVGNEE
jgi:hypothetical protein